MVGVCVGIDSAGEGLVLCCFFGGGGDGAGVGVLSFVSASQFLNPASQPVFEKVGPGPPPPGSFRKPRGKGRGWGSGVRGSDRPPRGVAPGDRRRPRRRFLRLPHFPDGCHGARPLPGPPFPESALGPEGSLPPPNTRRGGGGVWGASCTQGRGGREVVSTTAADWARWAANTFGLPSVDTQSTHRWNSRVWGHRPPPIYDRSPPSWNLGIGSFDRKIKPK